MVLSRILGVWVSNTPYHGLPLHGSLAFDIQHEAWIPSLSGHEEEVRTFSEAEKQNGIADFFDSPAWLPQSGLLQALSSLSLADKYVDRCGQILKAYAAGDYDTLNNVMTSGFDLGSDLRTKGEACLQDMRDRGGCDDRVSNRLQVTMGRKSGRHPVHTPSPAELGAV
eukprot:TRINITY_DN10065_c0_g1_i2.p1 TRINITY_DN10065_c0_g1~~TRINITY_DN10065_c0_g1_i2.p1  ORF type:complete len:168 (-),score=20.86 TRINITY_DN10065_c0_g1_i2:22-525(-)